MEVLARTTKSIQDISDDLLQCIFARLRSKDLQQCRSVCSRFRNVIDAQAESLNLWQSHVQHLMQKGAWYERFPALKKLELFGGKKINIFLKSLHPAPWNITELVIKNNIGGPGAQALGSPGSPWVNLQILQLSNLDVKPSLLKKLAATTWAHLEEIHFEECTLHSKQDHSKALASFLSHCPCLKKLRFWLSDFNANVLRHIMAAKLPLLEEFYAEGCGFGKREVAVIVKHASVWPCLKCLGLGWNHFENEGLIELTKAEFPMLEYLGLNLGEWEPSYNPDSLMALRNAMETRWPAFNSLSIDNIEIDAGVAFLQGNCPMLRKFNLERALSAPKFLRAFVNAAQNGRLKLLESLWVGSRASSMEEGTAEALKDLLVTAAWPNLICLRLALLFPTVGDTVVPAIAEAVQKNHFPAVKTLDIYWDDILPFDAKTPFQHPWPSVEELSIKLDNESTSAFIAVASVNLPNLKVLRLLFGDSMSDEALQMVFDAAWPALREIKSGGWTIDGHLLQHIEEKWDFDSHSRPSRAFRRGF